MCTHTHEFRLLSAGKSEWSAESDGAKNCKPKQYKV